MKTYEQFMTEGKLYATTKDGVRKVAKHDDHAAEIRASYHNPKKDPAYVKPKYTRTKKPDPVDYKHLAMHIMHSAGDHYPDTDGFDSVVHHVRKTYPAMRHADELHIADHMNKAVKRHLGAKGYGHYIDKTFKEFDKEYGKQ